MEWLPPTLLLTVMFSTLMFSVLWREKPAITYYKFSCTLLGFGAWMIVVTVSMVTAARFLLLPLVSLCPVLHHLVL